MSKRRHIQTQGLALNFASGTAPEWVQLTPAGPALVGRDGRAWVMSNPAAVAARFDPAKMPQIDIEHSSEVRAPQGMDAPAVGWMMGIEVRGGALWGRVDWNASGADLVAGRAYRYLSPVFTYDENSREVLAIVSAGLTNSPNFEMAALNAAQKESEPMDAAVLEALGLNPTATAAEAVLAINTIKADKATAMNRAETPDPEKFVPKADHQLALNRIATLETGEKTRLEEKIVATVDAAVAAGKIAPASKDYHLATCRQEGGLARFEALVAASPDLAGKSDLDKKTLTNGGAALNAEELAMCRVMGMSQADFIAARDKKE